MRVGCLLPGNLKSRLLFTSMDDVTGYPVSSTHDTTYVVCVLLLHAKSNSVCSSHLLSWPRRAQNWMRLRGYAVIGIAIVDPVMLVCPRSALGSATF